MPRLTEYSKKHPSFRMDAFFVADSSFYAWDHLSHR